MVSFDRDVVVSRRAVIEQSAGVVGLGGLFSRSDDEGVAADGRCPEATVEPAVHHPDEAGMDCDPNHPKSKALQTAVRESLETSYPTVGALIDQGYVPYFDFLEAKAKGAEGYSHWLNPEFLADDEVMDPAKPASILVDNRWWRPMGVMFVAVENGDPLDDPPPVYEEGEKRCAPWHYHVGLPGRYAWWKFRKVYGTERLLENPRLPCRTPYMMHVWTFDNPKGIYAHGAPPREERGGPPAESPGFETDAEPGEDDLGWDVLPDRLDHGLL